MPQPHGLDAATTRARDDAASTAQGIGNVLVGIDFQDGGRIALQRAAALPFAAGSGLELLHVVTHGESYVRAFQQIDEERDDFVKAQPQLADRVHASVAYGSPATAIADRAHHTLADLVVLGHHPAAVVTPRHLGITAARVIARSSTPVLLVASLVPRPYRRPLIAVDASDVSRAAVDLVPRLCRAERVDVVCAVAADHEVGPARDALAPLLRSADAALEWNAIVEVGIPAAVILRVAEARGSDLIAMTTRRLGSLREWVIGSVAREIMHAATVDLLVAR